MYAQYNDNVIGPGSPRYDNAYFVINFVRVYTVNGLSSSISSSLQQSSTVTAIRTDGTPTATGSTVGPNAGIVLDVTSSLQLFFLCVVGVIAVVV